MTTTRLPRMPRPADHGLAEGFARHVERWALAQGADGDTARAAGHAASALSLATTEGHVCIALRDLSAMPDGPTNGLTNGPMDAPSWRRTLLASGVVGTAELPGSMPLILDGDDRLYLHRHFDYERRLAHRLMRALGAGSQVEGDGTTLTRRLGELFAAHDAEDGRQRDSADWQQLAAALALRGRLTIISGGPGTGKTTTVVNLLACLLELDPACRIALAAPTGKAAARMTEAIRQRASHLPEAIRARLPVESFTVHRLLGVTPAAGGFVHHAGNLLALDALVVDEASMLDLALATQLLEAMPASARIVLLGDKDQLSAVESGAVFSELSVDPSLSEGCIQDLAALTATPVEHIRPPAPMAPSALRDAVVWFDRNFRFASDSGIGRLAALVNAGDAEQALAWLGSHADSSVRWIADGSSAPSAPSLQAMVAGYAPFVDAVRRDTGDQAAITAAFARFRVLCALREGPRGVGALNRHLERQFRAALRSGDGIETSPWYAGRPVLVLRNDHVLKLFNGDIGITLPDEAGELAVFFPEPAGGFRAVAPVRLPLHESAFAMTVHKSQGSEFDEVLVLLPEQRSRVLTRELLYTAVTRARGTVTVCAGSGVLAAAIESTTRRHSGLLARLREAASPATRDA